MAQQIVTDFDSSNRKAPIDRAQSNVIPGPGSDGLQTINSRASGQNIDVGGQGAAALASAGEQYSAIQSEAEQKTWLMNASSAYDLNATAAMNEAMRNAKPGEDIMPAVQDSLQKLRSDSMNGVNSPTLQQGLGQQISGANAKIYGQTQQFNFQSRDQNTDFNFQQGLNNMATRIGASKSYDEANQVGQDYLGQALQTISDTPALPEQKLKWTQQARGLISSAANTSMMNLDGQRWVSDHASAFPAQVGESIGVTRGIRNSNPFNIEGQQGFQGQSGTDKGGYATFDTPEDGLRAGFLNLKNQQDLHGLQTVQDIMTKYAPPNENNTAAYVQDVSAKLGVTPDQKIDLHDPATLKAFGNAIIAHENNGANPYHDQSTDWAVKSALGQDAGDKPTSARDDGGSVNSNPLWNVMTYEEQQKMATEYVTKQRQERTILSDYRKEAESNLKNLNDNMAKGIMPSDDELKQLDEAAQQSGSQAIQNQAEHLHTISQAAGTIRQMNPTDVGTYIDQLQSMPQSLDRDNKLVYAQKFQATQQKELAANPLGFYQNTGHQVPGIDFNKPETLQARATTAHNLVANYGTDINKSFFTPAETNQLIHTFQQSDLDTKRTMLMTFAKGFGSDTPAAAASLTKAMPNFGYAASLLGSAPNGTPDAPTVQTAMDIIAGDQRMKEDKNRVVSKTAIDNGLRSAGVDKVFANIPGAYDQVAGATQALYAARETNNSNTSKIKDYALEALGTKVASVNGNKVLAPVGVDPSEFQNFAQHMTPQQIQQAQTDAYSYLKGPSQKMMDIPHNADGPFDPAKNKMRLRTIGPNLYVMVGENGKNYTTADGPAILRITGDSVPKAAPQVPVGQ